MSFETDHNRKPIAGRDFDPNAALSQDDYEYLTGTGQYATPTANFSRPLAVGTYKPTPSFRSIPEHVAVCFDDDETLVAVVGAADDPQNVGESVEYAQLFAAAPGLLIALEIATTTLETIYKDDPRNVAAKLCIERNRAAIRKARGGAS